MIVQCLGEESVAILDQYNAEWLSYKLLVKELDVCGSLVLSNLVTYFNCKSLHCISGFMVPISVRQQTILCVNYAVYVALSTKSIPATLIYYAL